MNKKYYLKFLLTLPFKGGNLCTTKVESVLKIEDSLLKKNNIKIMVFDYDETLSSFHSDKLDGRIELFLTGLKKKGIKIAVISNSPKKRYETLEKLFSKFDAYVYKTSDKPSKKPFFEVLNSVQEFANNACMVGDRVGTDIYGAYLAEYKLRILVEPYSEVFGGKKAPRVDRFIKKIEKIFI